MLPLVGIPATISKFLKSYRQVFRKETGFQHISRYINGLLMSPNKTLQGIYSQLVWDEEQKVSRRAMHEAVFEAGWNHQELMKQHRTINYVSRTSRKRKRNNCKGIGHFPIILIVRKFSQPNKRMIMSIDAGVAILPVVTASISNGQRVDGIAVKVQHPNYEKEELAYLEMTAQESYRPLA